LLAGPIAFVGLIAPHICRRWFGPDHRMLLATTPFVGACFLAVAFAFVHATGAWFNGDLPIGVITALCGGPLFLVMLRKRAGWGDA
jgi:iron complex transport system permease protein